MNRTFAGKVTATQLASHGRNSSQYGYISITNDQNKSMKFKVDFKTECETLVIGDQVIVEAESLGTQGIWVARKVLKDLYVARNQPEEAVT